MSLSLHVLSDKVCKYQSYEKLAKQRLNYVIKSAFDFISWHIDKLKFFDHSSHSSSGRQYETIAFLNRSQCYYSSDKICNCYATVDHSNVQHT